MTKPPRVLIVHASTGNGHISAANAIHAVLESRGIVSKVVDGLDFSPRLFRAWYAGGYEETVRRWPAFWGFLYRWSDRRSTAYHVQSAADLRFLRRIEHYLAEFQPTVVVCTHSLPQPILARFRRRFGYRIHVVITDLYPHRMWLRNAPDFFYAPHPWTVEELERRIPGASAKTLVTGIPVHPAFGIAETRKAARAALELGPGRVVMISAGGIGAGDFESAVDALAEVPDTTILAICGRNDDLFDDLTRKNQPSVRPMKRVPAEHMAQCMRAADLVIGKPGGLTVSEALAVGRPFVIYMPFLIPGQEEDNARFLVESGIGRRALDPEDLRRTVTEWLADAAALETAEVQSRAAGNPDSAERIADHLLAGGGTTLR